jgi:multicomponent Na+:H+ antiporter subunit A
VAFVFVLRRLPAHFTERRPTRRARLRRLVIAVAGGAAVAGTAVVLSAARTGPSTTSAEYVALAPEGAGATNVVSAIVVDFRALDTVGEIGVLFIAAAGVASLVLATRHDRRRRAEPDHEAEVDR